MAEFRSHFSFKVLAMFMLAHRHNVMVTTSFKHTFYVWYCSEMIKYMLFLVSNLSGAALPAWGSTTPAVFSYSEPKCMMCGRKYISTQQRLLSAVSLHLRSSAPIIVLCQIQLNIWCLLCLSVVLLTVTVTIVNANKEIQQHQQVTVYLLY